MFSREQAIEELKRRKGAQEKLASAETNYLRDYGYRPLARAGKSAAQGIAGIADFVNIPINAGLQAFGREPLQSVSDNVGQYIDEATGGLTVPQNNLEKIVDSAGQFVSGGAPYAGLAKGANILKNFSPQNAKELLGFGGAGAGFEAGHQIAPDNAIAPILGSIAGGIAPGVAGGIAKGVTRPNEALANTLNINSNKAAAFNEAGLNPTLADISDSRFIKGAQNILTETPVAGNVISKSIKETSDKIAKLGEGISQIEGGEIAQKGLRNFQSRGNEIAGKLQSKMASFVKSDENIPINKTLEAINRKPSFITPEAKAQFAKSSVGKEYNKLSQIAERNQGSVPYRDLVYFRQQIDDQINNFGLMGFNKEQGALKNLRGQIQSDFGNSFKEKGEGAFKAFERHNKFYSQFAKKNEDIVNGLIKNKTATETFKSIVNDLRVDAKKADTVLKTLKPEQKEIFSQSLVRELGMSPQNEFNPAYLATNFKKLEPKAQDVVLSAFNPELKKQFRATIDSIDNMKGTKAEGNPSGTFNQGLKLGTIGGILSNPIQTGALLTAAVGSAKLMTNPKFVNWLAKGAKLQSSEETARHLGALSTIAKTTPQIAPDIQKYLSNLNEENNNESQIEQENIAPESTSPQKIPFSREDAIRELERRRGTTSSNEDISNTIQSSASENGLNPEFVHKVAKIESNLNPNAKNPNSTASGLFQFTNGTWRHLVNQYGKDLDISLHDKNNPVANTKMASLYLRDNARKLTRILDREPTQGEVYASHVLGLGGANKLIKNYGKGKIASAIFPKEARVNKEIFYKNGKPVSIEQLYNFFSKKMSA